jgi:eukaryotic-like serine/threonine-protein kinase
MLVMDGDPLEIIGDLIDGQFRVDSFVGFGDLSVVYRGFHVGLEANVAIKFLELPTTLDDALVAPLIRSFREGTKLHYRLARGHMHIAQSIGSGQTIAPRTGAMLPYLVREWLDGESLNHNFADRRARHASGRTLAEAVDLFRGAMEGLGYAHRQGVAHLALNPSNLFLAQNGPETRLKILDFGVAHAMNEHAGPIRARKSSPHQPTGLRVLVPAYAAPEQLDAAIGQEGSWTDVYAMALLFVEALSDHPMFGDAPPPLDQKLRPSARKISLPPNLDDRMVAVLSRALLFAPRERHASAGVLWKDLSEAVPHRSIPVVRRPSTAPKMPAVHRQTLLGLQEHPEKQASKPPQAPPASSQQKPVARPSNRPPAPPLPPRKSERPPPPSQNMAPRSHTLPLHREIDDAPTRQEVQMRVATPLAEPMYLETIQRAREAHSVPSQEARLPPPPMLPTDPASQVFFASPPRTAPHPFFTPPPQPAIMPQDYNQPQLVPPQLTPLGSSRSAETVAPPPMFAPSKKWMAIVGGGLAAAALLVVVVILATHDSPEKKAAMAIPTASAAPQGTASSMLASSIPPVPTSTTTTSQLTASQIPTTPAPSVFAQNDPPQTAAARTRHRFIVRDGRAALDDASQSLADCKRPHGRSGAGQIRATFFPSSGKVIHVMLGPPYAGSDQGKCIIQKYREAHMDPFKGRPSAITYNFNFPR